MTEEETVPKRLRRRSEEHRNRPFSWTKDAEGTFREKTFSHMWTTATNLGAGLHALGVSRGDHVGIMSHNREEWIFCDLAILGIGAADVPRGADSTADEMAYIIGHADCRVVIAENPGQCEKILSKHSDIPQLERLILMDDYADPSKRPSVNGVTITTYRELLESGEAAGEEGRSAFEAAVDEGSTSSSQSKANRIQ